MYFQKNILPSLILAITIVFTIVMGVLLYLSPPALFPDPAWGFQVMRAMGMGGGFNLLPKPDQADILKNTVEFLTWWSPGQYLVPWAFRFLGMNIGQAAAVTITLCQLLGLSGFYYSFKKIGFSPLTAALSIAFIACQQFYALNYIFYNGGEILLFAFTGWFLYGCISLQKIDLRLLIFVLLSGWIGFFCKSSVMWVYLAGLFFLWLRLSLPQKSVASHVKNGIWIALPAVASVLAIYLFFLSKGQNPASTAGALKLSWQTFSFPLASPLLAGFSVDDLSNGLLFPSGAPVFSPAIAILIIVILALISLLLIFAILRYIPNNDYKLLVLVFYALSVMFFSYAYLRQMTISYEARHYRVMGIIVIPGILYLLGQLNVGYRVLFGLIWIGITLSTFNYLTKGYRLNEDKNVRGISGFTHQFIDQKSLHYVVTLDNKSHGANAIFAFLNNDTGLEIKNSRIITLDQIADYSNVNIEDYEYDGHAGPLYILLPVSYQGLKANTIMKFFSGYKDFTETWLSENYILYSAK